MNRNSSWVVTRLAIRVGAMVMGDPTKSLRFAAIVPVEAAPALKDSRRPHDFPPVVLRETPDSLIVEAEVPGVAPEDLSVEVQRDVLTLSGQPRVQTPQGYVCIRQERFNAAFSRSIKLLSEVHGDRADARLERGLLTVRLPKRPSKARQEIGIRVL